MANLKETRNRIKGIKSTQKITKAMKMVATAKLKKIRDNLVHLKEYTSQIEYLISATLSNLPEDDLRQVSNHPLITKAYSGSNFPHLIIFNTSNKGLCGGINNQNIKHLKHRISDLKSRNHKILIYCIGKKGFDYCTLHYPEYLLNKSAIMVDEKTGFNAEMIKNEITEIIANNHISASSMVFSHFISTTTQKPAELPLTPIHSHKLHSGNIRSHHYTFDVPQMELIQKLMPEYMLCKVLSSICENATSEQSARMIAMENANNSAGKIIKSLTLTYNRLRQSNITSEISEIASGVEALKQV